MNEKEISVDAAVGVTGTDKPLIYKETGEPVSGVIYSTSKNSLEANFNVIHPSIIAKVPSTEPVELADSVKNNLIILPVRDVNEGDDFVTYVIVEKYPVKICDGRASIRENGLYVVVEDVCGDEYSVFTTSNLACSDTGDGIIVDIKDDSIESVEHIADDIPMLILYGKDREKRVAFAMMYEDGLNPDKHVISSVKTCAGGFTHVGFWVEND